jgi:solute:Na+ symporter, SSS family
MNTLHSADYVVFLIYFLAVAGYGYWIYTKKKPSQFPLRTISSPKAH